MYSKINRIFYSLFYTIILISPLVIYGFSFGGLSFRLSRFLIILISPLTAIKILINPSLVLRDFFLCFAIIPFTLYTSISVFWTPPESFDFGVGRLFSMYEVFMLYVICVVADLDKKKFNLFIRFYVFSSLLPVLIGIWQLSNNLFQFSNSEVPFTKFLISGKYDEFTERFAQVAEGVSRVSSSFAEATIYGTYMSSVLLASFLIDYSNKRSKILFRTFQAISLTVMILTLSKLAILLFLIGVIIIIRKKIIKVILFLLILGVLLLSINKLLQFYNISFIAERLFEDTGHTDLLFEALNQLLKINFFLGNGIGSIPNSTTNLFLLSRVYETGLLGLIFALGVSFLPVIFFKLRVEKNNLKKDVIISIIITVIIGLHLYDYFIYLWPWLIIGGLISFHNNQTGIILKDQNIINKNI